MKRQEIKRRFYYHKLFRKKGDTKYSFNSHSKLKAGRILLVQVQGINGDKLSTEDVKVIDINRKGKVIRGLVLKKKNSGDFLYFRCQIFYSFFVLASTEVFSQGPLSELK